MVLLLLLLLLQEELTFAGAIRGGEKYGRTRRETRRRRIPRGEESENKVGGGSILAVNWLARDAGTRAAAKDVRLILRLMPP